VADKYEHEVSLAGNDSYAKIAALVPANTLVLDLGTGPGGLGKHLKQNLHCTVDGVELCKEYLDEAAPFYRNLWQANLETADIHELLGNTKYDRIICADILEHLRNPEELLTNLVSHLSDSGKILISIPNVSYAGVLSEIIVKGDFLYRDNGILDRTHVRFFTRKSLINMLTELNMTISHFDTIEIDFDSSEFGFNILKALPSELFHALAEHQDSRTYQFIVEVSPGDTSTNSKYIIEREIDWSKGLLGNYEQKLALEIDKYERAELKWKHEREHLNAIISEQQAEIERRGSELDKKREQLAGLKGELEVALKEHK